MPIFTSWVHGNGLTIETPVMYNADGQAAERLILTPAGPGAWVEPEREGVGAVSWLHLPIPIGGISQLERADLLRVFLLFRVWGSLIDSVHIYDGYHKIEEFNDLARGDRYPFTGNFLVKSSANTFKLQRPYPLTMGVGLSFLFKAPTGPGYRGVVIVSAGAEFRTRSLWSGPFGNP